MSQSVCLVTGGHRRLGFAMARVLARRGLHVVLTYRGRKEEAEAAVSALAQEGGSAEALKADFTRPETAAVVARTVLERGEPKVCVLSASTFDETDLAHYDDDASSRTVQVNLLAPLSLAGRLGPTMVDGGLIVFMSDRIAVRPYRHHLVYGAAKAGLLWATRALALELAPRVRVNAILPGPILPPEGASPLEIERRVRDVPLGRWGGIEPIARTLEYLLDADFVTGEGLLVDGGITWEGP